MNHLPHQNYSNCIMICVGHSLYGLFNVNQPRTLSSLLYLQMSSSGALFQFTSLTRTYWLQPFIHFSSLSFHMQHKRRPLSVISAPIVGSGEIGERRQFVLRVTLPEVDDQHHSLQAINRYYTDCQLLCFGGSFSSRQLKSRQKKTLINAARYKIYAMKQALHYKDMTSSD